MKVYLKGILIKDLLVNYQTLFSIIQIKIIALQYV